MLHVNCNISFVQEQLRFCSKANVRRVCLPSVSDRGCEFFHTPFFYAKKIFINSKKLLAFIASS